MIDLGSKSPAGLVAKLKNRAGNGASGQTLRRELESSLEEFAHMQREVYAQEREEFNRWKKERDKWVKGYQKIFAGLPGLMEKLKESLSVMSEDDAFNQAPEEVQERLRNRKQGLEIVCRMLERLPQRKDRLDQISANQAGRLKRVRLPGQDRLSKLEPISDSQGNLSEKATALLEQLEAREKEAREQNYQVTRELRLVSQNLEQEVAKFLRDFLLPAVDGLERGVWDEASLKQPLLEYPAQRELIDKWFGLYHRCCQDMVAYLKRNGLRHIEVKQGELFDPEQHMALGHEACDSLENEHILEVIRSGWNYHHLTLRPVEVIVVRNEGERKNGA